MTMRIAWYDSKYPSKVVLEKTMNRKVNCNCRCLKVKKKMHVETLCLN
jgi:hypothetical protein